MLPSPGQAGGVHLTLQHIAQRIGSNMTLAALDLFARVKAARAAALAGLDRLAVDNASGGRLGAALDQTPPAPR